MTDMRLKGTVVTICDWNGRVIWTSDDQILIKKGDLAWCHIATHLKSKAETAFARVVTLGETTVVEFETNAKSSFAVGCGHWVHQKLRSVC